MFAKRVLRRVSILAAVAIELATGACGSNAPLPVVPAPAPLVIMPRGRLEQFSSAVGDFRRDVELVHTVPTAAYADLRIALGSLADTIQLLPRGADAIATIDVASSIRNDVVKVGSPVLDDPQRTVAVQRALATASRALDDVVSTAYSDTPELGPMMADLNDAIHSIDGSRLLADERQDVLRVLDQSVRILQAIELAVGAESG